MISPENKSVAITLAILLGGLFAGKLALWPWLIKRRSHRIRGISRD